MLRHSKHSEPLFRSLLGDEIVRVMTLVDRRVYQPP
jgi:hypothetical protein